MIVIKENDFSENTQIDDLIELILFLRPNAKEFCIAFDKFDAKIIITGLNYNYTIKELKEHLICRMLSTA